MEFYYQIKGKNGSKDSFESNWSFPPIFSGKVQAETKKEARELINKEYGVKFPMRVLSKDLESKEFLLALQEIDEKSRLNKLFIINECLMCGDHFRIIDKYNDSNCRNKGSEFCSNECKDQDYKTRKIQWNENMVTNGSSIPVIYKITNSINNKSYIGKTTQVFTLRWYQHFFQTSGSKFHQEIENTKVTDWVFQVIEMIKIEKGINFEDAEKIIKNREQFFIDKYDSIENGYNSVKSIK